jgi:3-oxoacyl-[acyl-carrier-protein] synthase II
MQLKRVVVTGMGALTPIGNTLGEYWHALVQGTSGANLITRFDPEAYKVKFACEIKNFDPLTFMDRKEARKMDPFTHYAMACADEAIADSGLLQQPVNLDRIGVIWGAQELVVSPPSLKKPYPTPRAEVQHAFRPSLFLK